MGRERLFQGLINSKECYSQHKKARKIDWAVHVWNLLIREHRNQETCCLAWRKQILFNVISHQWVLAHIVFGLLISPRFKENLYDSREILFRGSNERSVAFLLIGVKVPRGIGG